jgi:beta-lactam-binding protein with PASTA domain
MLRRILTYLAIFAAAIVAVALLLNFVMAIVVGGRQVDVPEVRGLSEPNAAEVLRRSGLKCQQLAEEYCLDYAESTIVTQDPPAGKTVKQGRKVFVTLSLGPEFHDVPYCAGKPLRSAEILIEKAGFVVGNVAWTSRDGTYADEVVSTEPAPGSAAMRGSAVNILASTGGAYTRYILPDLKGKHYIAARAVIEGLGMFVRESGSQRDLMTQGARIVMQEPPPGFIVARGDTILISVSSRYDKVIEL